MHRPQSKHWYRGNGTSADCEPTPIREIRWSPPGLRIFGRAHARTCLDGKWLAFVGDSITRDLFYEWLALLDRANSQRWPLYERWGVRGDSLGKCFGSRDASYTCSRDEVVTDPRGRGLGTRMTFAFSVYGGASESEVALGRRTHSPRARWTVPTALLIGCPVFAFVDPTAYRNASASATASVPRAAANAAEEPTAYLRAARACRSYVERVFWARYPRTPVFYLGLPDLRPRVSGRARAGLERSLQGALGIGCSRDARGDWALTR